MILYNNSGGAHISASKQLKKLLKQQYCLTFIDFSEDIISKAWGIISTDDFYNDQLKKRNFAYLNFVSSYIVPPLLKIGSYRIKKQLARKIDKKNPDLIISTIPVVNSIIIDVAKKRGIPSIIMTLDIDLHNWIMGVNKSLMHNSKTYFTWGLSPYPGIDQLLKIGVPRENIIYTGFPIRNIFKKNKSKQSARNILHVEDDKFVVLVMLGANASDFILQAAKNIEAPKDREMHVFFVAGHNKEVQEKLKLISPNKNVSFTNLGFVEDIATLMQASDVLITKPGGQSIHEAVNMKLPIILDMSKGVMKHEMINADFIDSYNLGLLLKDIGQLNTHINFIANKKNSEHLKHNFDNILIKDFDNEFTKLVNEIIY